MDDDEEEDDEEVDDPDEAEEDDGEAEAEAGPSSGCAAKRGKTPSKGATPVKGGKTPSKGVTPAKRGKTPSKRPSGVAGAYRDSGYVPEGAVAPKGIRLFFSPVRTQPYPGGSYTCKGYQLEGGLWETVDLQGGLIYIRLACWPLFKPSAGCLAYIPAGCLASRPLSDSSQVLNAFVWGPSLRKMQQEGRQLAVSAMRGGFLWLEVTRARTSTVA